MILFSVLYSSRPFSYPLLKTSSILLAYETIDSCVSMAIFFDSIAFFKLFFTVYISLVRVLIVVKLFALIKAAKSSLVLCKLFKYSVIVV